MLANLLRQLLGRTERGPAGTTPATEARVDIGAVRGAVHAQLREGRIAEALGEIAPALAAGADVAEIRTLCEFSIRNAAGLARQDAWRRDIAYLLGAILLALDDEEGARLCMRVSWPGEGALAGLRRFSRGPDIAAYCRQAGLPCEAFTDLVPQRMDGRTEPQLAAQLDAAPATLCMLPDALVLGQSFLPVSRDGLAFTERCTDSPAKLGRFDGIEQLDTLRLATEGRLWAAGGDARRHAGPHVLIGNHVNIGHWLLYFFTRTRQLRDRPALREAKVVVGENLLPLHAECLARAGIAADRLVRLPAGAFAEFEQLWVPTLSCGISGRSVLYWAPGTLEYVRATLGVAPGAARGRRRVYLSRRGARWRRLLNEDEVAAALAALGFEEVDPGSLDLQQQIDLAGETEAIVGCFGAGMNFHLFAGEGVPVVQIQPEAQPRMNIHVHLARALGQPFHALVAEVPVRHADPLRSDFRVPPEELKRVVSRALQR